MVTDDARSLKPTRPRSACDSFAVYAGPLKFSF
jgi:hypothetical protein